MARPVLFQWDGTCMVPHRRFDNMAKAMFRPGHEYALVEFETRSHKSHRHYFAIIKEGWMQLPELEASQFKTPEHLRHRCLIESGYCNEKTIVCDTEHDAERMAIFAAEWNEYALVKRTGTVVSVFTAMSQSVSAMNDRTFQKSKTRVLEIIAAKIGITVDDLTSNTGQAA